MEGAGPVMVLEGALKFRNRFAFTTHTQPHLTVLNRNQSFSEALILNSKSILFDVFLPCDYRLHQRTFPIILVKRAGAIKWILMVHMIKKCGNNLRIPQGNGVHDGLRPVSGQHVALAPPALRIRVKVFLREEKSEFEAEWMSVNVQNLYLAPALRIKETQRRLTPMPRAELLSPYPPSITAGGHWETCQVQRFFSEFSRSQRSWIKLKHTTCQSNSSYEWQLILTTISFSPGLMWTITPLTVFIMSLLLS